MRAGTTTFADCVNQHPKIYMPTPFIPEPKVFTNPTYKNIDYLWQYELLYDKSGAGGKVLGEKTVNYLETKYVAETIYRVLPKVELVFMLRDPVERAYSNWCWSKMNNWEPLSFEQAIIADGKRGKPPEIMTNPFNYLERGLYHKMLKPYFEIFPRRQIKIYLFENFKEDVIYTCNNFFSTLGLPDFTVQVPEFKNETKKFAPLTKHTKEWLRAYYDMSVGQLHQNIIKVKEAWRY